MSWEPQLAVNVEEVFHTIPADLVAYRQIAAVARMCVIRVGDQLGHRFILRLRRQQGEVQI